MIVMATNWWGLAGIAFGVLILAFILRPAKRTGTPTRCKIWLPLSYIDGSRTDDTTPHVLCALPAGHRPASRHLADPEEIRELQLARAPF